jgi:hypothetical protein
MDRLGRSRTSPAKIPGEMRVMTYKVRKTLGPPSRPDLQGPCVIEDEHGKVIATMEGFGSEEQYQLACKIVGDGALLEEMARALDACIKSIECSATYYQNSLWNANYKANHVLQKYREMKYGHV